MLSKRIFVLVSLLLISFSLVGCGTTPPIVDNHPPVITEISDQTATVGVEYTYGVDATDPDGDALTYSLISNPSGMEIDKHTGVITWEYPTVGKSGVKVMVSDGVLYVTQSFTVTVEPVEPVAEFIEIVVTPDTMALEVGETGTFTVAAHYSIGNPQDVTNICVYTQLTTGVITVTAGIVTADGVGTDTISISYTEGDITATANISVTVVTVRIPMEIIVDLLTFTADGPYWFTVTMIANDDLGESVKASFGWPISATEVKIDGILETDVVSDVNFALIGDVFQTDPFTMEDTITVNFRGTFTSPGTFFTTIEVETTDGILLCSEDITIVVEGDTLEVGDSFGGGIIVYTDGTGHGLIAATEDQTPTDSGILWATEDYQETTVPGWTLLTIGSGSANTDAIIVQNGEGITYAAGLARAYGGGGYDDWFLPSKDELDKLYDNQVAIGVFEGTYYWSSSESDAALAYCINIYSGAWISSPKSETHHVRAVRAF